MALALAVVLHLPGVFSGPIADDPLRYAETWTPLSTAMEWWVRPFPHTPGPLPDDFSPKLYRPMWRLSYWLDGALFGAPTARTWVPSAWGTGALIGPRMVSIGLFLGVLASLYRLLRGHEDTRPVAGLSVVLVALHPLLVSPVAWLSARGGLLALLGLLLAGGQAQRGGRWVGLWVLLAAGSKESALVAPLLIWIWSRRLRPTAVASGVVLGVLGMRWWTLGTPVGGFDGLPPLGSSVWMRGMAGHLGHLISAVPIDGGGVAFVVGLGAGTGALAMWGVWTRGRWVLLWLVVALLPTIQLFACPQTGLHARFLTDAAVPLCVAVAMGLGSLPSRVKWTVLPLLVGVWGAASMERVWAHRSAAAQVQAARRSGRVADLPPTVGGVVVGVNVEPWLSEPPWASP